MPIALKIILIINMVSFFVGGVIAIGSPIARHLSSEIGSPSPVQVEHMTMTGPEIRRRLLISVGSFLAIPILIRLFIPVLPGFVTYWWLSNGFSAGNAALYRATHPNSR